MDDNSSETFATITGSVLETEQLGAFVGQNLESYDVICLIGDLGAGKTAFTRGLARGWGSKDRVTSPTFKLVNQYSRPQDKTLIYHLDCYRLTHSDDAETIALEDLLDARAVVLIEWPEVVLDWLPEERLTLTISYIDESDLRQLNFVARGKRPQQLITHLKNYVTRN